MLREQEILAQQTTGGSVAQKIANCFGLIQQHEQETLPCWWRPSWPTISMALRRSFLACADQGLKAPMANLKTKRGVRASLYFKERDRFVYDATSDALTGAPPG